MPRLLRHVLVMLVTSALLLLGLPAQADVFGDDPGWQHGMSATRKVKRDTKVIKALHVAQRQSGDPYVYGAAGPHAFDCSGLVYFATHRAGFRGVPRTSAAQAGFMRHISRAKMRRGDFVFFTGGGGVYHVGIYVGRAGGRRVILHAPYPGTRVHREAIWTDSWFAGTLRGR